VTPVETVNRRLAVAKMFRAEIELRIIAGGSAGMQLRQEFVGREGCR
jgi:hypothetical protein